MLSKPLKVRFKHNKQPVKLVIMPPSYEVEQQLKTVYAVAYRKCIKQGVATRPSMMKLMEEEGLWDSEREGELTSLTVELGILETALGRAVEEGWDEDKQRELTIKLAGARSKVYELISIKTLPLEYTAEEIANDVQMDNFVALCTYVDDETCTKRYFANHDELVRRRQDVDVQKIFAALEEELNRDSVNLLMDLPEHKWLVKNKYMDKDGNFLVPEVEQEIAEDSGIATSTVVDELKKE